MIPRLIHYCWFGGKQIPDHLQQCMQTWRELMPEYQWVRWDEESFDTQSVAWTHDAYQAGKYAFVSDYVRLVALYQQGGIYLDTDVKLLKSLHVLTESFEEGFTGFESPDMLTSAVICASPHHPLIKEFLTYYDNRRFTEEIVSGNEANVRMMTAICQRYGMQANNTEQHLVINEGERYQSFHVFPKTYFCPLDFWHHRDFTSQTFAIHYFDASWLAEGTRQRILRERTLHYRLWTGLKVRLLELVSKTIS